MMEEKNNRKDFVFSRRMSINPSRGNVLSLLGNSMKIAIDLKHLIFNADPPFTEIHQILVNVFYLPIVFLNR